MKEFGEAVFVIMFLSFVVLFLYLLIDHTDKNLEEHAFYSEICTMNRLSWFDCEDLKRNFDYGKLKTITGGVLK